MNRIQKAQRKVASRGLVIVGEWLNGFVVARPENRQAASNVLAEIASCSAWDVAASNRLLDVGGSFVSAISLGVKHA